MVSRIGARHGRWLVVLVIMGLLAAMLPWGAGMAAEATPSVPPEETESTVTAEATAPLPDPTAPPPDPTAPPPDPTLPPEPTVAPSEPAQSEGMEAQSLEATGTIWITIEAGATFTTIPALEVCATESPSGTTMCGTTISEGEPSPLVTSLINLPYGTWTVRMSHLSNPNYETPERTVEVSESNPEPSVHFNVDEFLGSAPTPEPTTGHVEVTISSWVAYSGAVPAGLAVCLNPAAGGEPTCAATVGSGSSETVVIGDVPFGDYTLTLAGLPDGYPTLTYNDGEVITIDQYTRYASFSLDQLPPVGDLTITVDIDPGDRFASGIPEGSQLTLERQQPAYYGFPARDISAGGPVLYENVSAGTYGGSVWIPGYEPVVISGVVVEADTTISVDLDGAVPLPIVSRLDIRDTGNRDGTWTGGPIVSPTGAGPLPIVSGPLTVDEGVFTPLADGTYTFAPSGPGLIGTLELDVDVELPGGSTGTARIDIVFGAYWLAGYGATVSTSIYIPLEIDPAGTQACLIPVDAAGDVCTGLIPTERAGEGTRVWEVIWIDVPDGTYTLEYRNIPGHPNVTLTDPTDVVMIYVEVASGEVVQVSPSVFLRLEDFEPIEPGTGSISVTLLAGPPYGDAVAAGIPVCIDLEQVPDDAPACQLTTGGGNPETLTFTGLPLDQYRITVSTPGYVEWVETRTLTAEAPDASAEVYLFGLAPLGTASLTQPIVPGAAFAGGVPAGSAACLTLTEPTPWGFDCWAMDGITAQTDYTWSNLPAGTYELRITVPLRATEVIGGIVLAEGETLVRDAFDLSGMVPAPVTGQIDVDWYGNDGEWGTFFWLDGIGYIAIDPASLPALDIGTLRLSDDGLQLLFRPLPDQQGTHTFTVQTVGYGEATVTVVFRNYRLPGYGHISVLVNDVSGASIPAGYEVCATSDALPDGPRCREVPAAEWPESGAELTNVPYGTYTVTLTDGSTTWTYPVDLVVDEARTGFALFNLSNLPPAPGTASLKVMVDPGGQAPASGAVFLRLDPQGYMYPAQSFDGIEEPVDLTFGRLPAGDFTVEVQVWPYQPITRPVTLAEGGHATVAVSLDDLQEYPLETAFRVTGYGGEPQVWRFPFPHPVMGAVEIEAFEPITVDGFGTLSRDPNDPYTLRFEPAGPDIIATHTFEVPTVRGPGTVTVVMDTDYWWPGDAALVPIQLRMPVELDLVAAGTEVCLIDGEGGETCLAVPAQDYKGRFERYWDVLFFDVAPGTYDVAIRNVPGYGDTVLAGAVVVPPDLDPAVLDVVMFGVDDLEPEPEGADITVPVDPASVPAGSEVCLVNEDETVEDLCQPADGSATTGLTNINALRQTESVTTLVFENVPPGIWRVVVRVEGYHDVEVATLKVQPDGTVTDPADEPIEPIIVVPAITVDELEPTVAELTVISRFCDVPKSRAATCSTRLPQAEGTSVTFTITGSDTNETLQVTIGRQGKSSQGSATITLPTLEEYTVCQLPVEGYTPSPSACVEVDLDGDGAEVPVNNIKTSG